MREETAQWLNPMFDEAAKRGDVDVLALIRQASMPAAEACNPALDSVAEMHPDTPGVRHLAVDWIRFGQLLRHQLGWDDAYPVYPDFPEARDTP